MGSVDPTCCSPTHCSIKGHTSSIMLCGMSAVYQQSSSSHDVYCAGTKTSTPAHLNNDMRTRKLHNNIGSALEVAMPLHPFSRIIRSLHRSTREDTVTANEQLPVRLL